jgi:formamidopyrimidine-DNA glycosylase
MPELPEVETVCRGLAPVLEGRRLARITLRRRDLRIPFPKDLVARAEGQRVERIYRRAKYIIMALSNGDALVAHLGMSGRMLVVKDKATPFSAHDHVIFTTEDGAEVRFNDPRRFGLLTITPLADLDAHKLFRHLGPDPLTDGFTPAALSAALKGRKTSIKVALLDQRIVVGVGNIYACESLYLAGLSPKRKAGTVAGAKAEPLVAAIRKVLKQAIAAGGSSLRDHVQPSGELGYFQHAWKVYGREGEPCACFGEKQGAKRRVIKRIVQGGRSTFFCAHCQK